jgi:hypothetical protein
MWARRSWSLFSVLVAIGGLTCFVYIYRAFTLHQISYQQAARALTPPSGWIRTRGFAWDPGSRGEGWRPRSGHGGLNLEFTPTIATVEQILNSRDYVDGQRRGTTLSQSHSILVCGNLPAYERSWQSPIPHNVVVHGTAVHAVIRGMYYWLSYIYPGAETSSDRAGLAALTSLCGV